MIFVKIKIKNSDPYSVLLAIIHVLLMTGLCSRLTYDETACQGFSHALHTAKLWFLNRTDWRVIRPDGVTKVWARGVCTSVMASLGLVSCSFSTQRQSFINWFREVSASSVRGVQRWRLSSGTVPVDRVATLMSICSERPSQRLFNEDECEEGRTRRRSAGV